MNQPETKQLNLRPAAAVLLLGYWVLVVLLYVLMGYQLHFRESQGYISMANPDAGSVELISGTVVEQTFSVHMQRIQSINVQWGAYYRSTNSGTVTVGLYNGNTGECLLSQDYDASTFTESCITTVTEGMPLDDIDNLPLVLRLTADSPEGGGVTPLIASNGAAEANAALPKGRTAFAFTVNGHPNEGLLSFSVTGEDLTWIGLYYWRLAAAVWTVLAAYLLWCWHRWKVGKPTLLVGALMALQKYRFLIKQLVDRDFKAKYKRSILGVFWSFLNPLLNMLVQYVVFSNMFRFDIAYFPVYLLCGNVVFNYFSEACGMSLVSIIGNKSLITKVYMPKYIYPLTRILSSLINLLISLIPLMAVALLSGLPVTKAFLLLPIPLLLLAMFCLGLGLLLSAAMVFFRDIQFLWSVLTTIWMYLTPIFYPVSVLPEQIQAVVKMNPLYFYVTFVRSCIIDGISPDPHLYISCAVVAVVMLAVGSMVFKKTQDQFVLYL